MNSLTNPLRYSRQTALPAIGSAGQLRLQNSRVLIIGAGGLGVPASVYLASSGVGDIVVNDFDTVDITNLPRQIYYRATDAGLLKANVAVERLREINPDVRAVALTERMTADTLHAQITAADAVLDCTDNFASRWLINEACFKLSTPLVSGAAIRWEGQVTVFRFAQNSGACYRCLYGEEDESLQDCAGQGIVAPVAGTIGTMMATETIKLLLGVESGLTGKLWAYDGMAGSSRTIKINRLDNCPVCG